MTMTWNDKLMMITTWNDDKLKQLTASKGLSEEAKAAVFEYIWIFYNRRRIHEANGYLTPEEYYQQHQTDLKAA